MARGKQLSLQPPIDFHIVKRYYFIYNHVVYSVTQAHTDIFKAAIIEKSPYWKHCAPYSQVLKQAEIDYPTRWWLLCCLVDVSKGIMLYQSRESADQACKQVAV